MCVKTCQFCRALQKDKVLYQHLPTGLRKTTKILPGTRSLGRDLILGPSEYEAWVLIIYLRNSVFFFVAGHFALWINFSFFFVYLFYLIWRTNYTLHPVSITVIGDHRLKVRQATASGNYLITSTWAYIGNSYAAISTIRRTEYAINPDFLSLAASWN
jgi:hypothetical protein